MLEKRVSCLEAENVARDVGESQVIKAALCAKAWPSSNSHGEPLRAFRRRSDVVFKSTPSGVL